MREKINQTCLIGASLRFRQNKIQCVKEREEGVFQCSKNIRHQEPKHYYRQSQTQDSEYFHKKS